MILGNKLSFAYQWMFVGSLKSPVDEKEIGTLLALNYWNDLLAFYVINSRVSNVSSERGGDTVS